MTVLKVLVHCSESHHSGKVAVSEETMALCSSENNCEQMDIG